MMYPFLFLFYFSFSFSVNDKPDNLSSQIITCFCEWEVYQACVSSRNNWEEHEKLCESGNFLQTVASQRKSAALYFSSLSACGAGIIHVQARGVEVERG